MDGGTRAARTNLIAFTERMFPRYRAAAHHLRIAAALQDVESGKIDRLCITVAPRHGKSEIASVHFPAWYLGRNPDKRIIGTSYAAGLAYRFSRRARNLVASPAWPFPELRTAGDWSAVQAWDIANHRGGYVAAGVGGSITGHGADVLLIDDPTASAEEAASEAFRTRAWEWFTETALTRLEPGGAVILIGTRWHADDLIGRALAMDGAGWHHIHLPAIDDDGRALWPERFDLAALERIRDQIGSRAFESLYQGRPSPAEGGTFKRHWWRFWHVPGQPLPPVPVRLADGTIHQCPSVPLPYAFDESIQSWDLTFKAAADGSYVVGQVWSRLGADAFLCDQVRDRLDFPQTLGAIEGLSRRWPEAATKLIERAANGEAVLATLAGRIPGLVGVAPTGSKEARANAATPFPEAGNVYLPHPALFPWVEGFIEEAAAFPTGAHDDQVDALSQALARLLAGRIGTGAAEALAEAMAWQS